MNILYLPQKISLYLKQVRVEVKKINWPTKKETIRYSLMVIVISAVVAAYLGGLDFILSSLLRKAIDFFS